MRFLDAEIGAILNPASLTPRGQTVVRGASSVDYFTPWTDRQTDKATFGCEVMTLPTDVTITFMIQKKFRDETDDEAKDTTSASFTSAGVQTVRVTSIDDVFRYKVTIAGTASVGHAHLRFLNPSWEPH